MTKEQIQAIREAVNKPAFKDFQGDMAQFISEAVDSLDDEQAEALTPNLLRISVLNKVIANLPEGLGKSCQNCANLGKTIIPLGIYWAHHRCLHCENFSNWSDVVELPNEIKEWKD